MTNFGMMVSSLKQNIARAVVGKDDVVELMLTALLCEGHVLIEDVPGVGKTTLASALARSLSCSFKRIQFTPDITPSDITGFTMPSLSGEMQYHPGCNHESDCAGPTKSTAPLRKRSPRCWRLWKSGR